MKMHKKCLAVLLIACCAALPAAGADTGETEPAGGNAQEERTADPSLTNQIEPYPAAEKLLPPLPAPPSSGQDVKAFLSYGKAVQAYVEAAQKYIDGATNDANAIIQQRNQAVQNANRAVNEYNQFLDAQAKKKS
jgi:hypothetical protein